MNTEMKTAMKIYEARAAQVTGKTADGEWRIRAENDAGLKPGIRIWIQPVPSPSASLKQKRMCWALLYEISRWQKESPAAVSEQRKLSFCIYPRCRCTPPGFSA